MTLQTLSSEERLRRAPFLTVLGTHCISRNFPLPPQRMLASLTAVSVAAGPASHAHPVASKRPRNQTPHAYAACCVGVPSVAVTTGNTLEACCCRTRRRLCEKHRLRRPSAADDGWARGRRPRSRTTPGDGPPRTCAANPSGGTGPHTCRRPAQPSAASHPDHPRPLTDRRLQPF